MTVDYSGLRPTDTKDGIVWRTFVRVCLVAGGRGLTSRITERLGNLWRQTYLLARVICTQRIGEAVTYTSGYRRVCNFATKEMVLGKARVIPIEGEMGISDLTAQQCKPKHIMKKFKQKFCLT